MSERTVTLTLRRPLTLIDADESGDHRVGSTLPVGTTVFAEVEDEEILLADVGVQMPIGAEGFTDNAPLLAATAEVPCPHIHVDSCGCSDTCLHPSWFGCHLHGDENTVVCLGDMARCPFAEIRAQSALQSQKGENSSD